MSETARVHRWRDVPLDKVTEMISRKVIGSDRQMLVQVYLKRGAHVPVHRHENDQMVYVLQGRLRCRVGSDDLTVGEGEVLHIPSGVRHQTAALQDTFELLVFSPARRGWLSAGGPGRSKTDQ